MGNAGKRRPQDRFVIRAGEQINRRRVSIVDDRAHIGEGMDEIVDEPAIHHLFLSTFSA